MEGLTEYNTVEDAFKYASTLVHDFVADNYDAEMDPQMYDQDPSDWSFVS